MNHFEIIETRVAQVRATLATLELDAFIVPHDDEHLGEYIPAYAERLEFDPALEEWQRLLLTDPQTSGGLLIAFAPEQVEPALAALQAAGVPATIIGRLVPSESPRVWVRGD